MVTPCGWSDVSHPVRRQVDTLVERIAVRFNDALVGIYLHGSLAMGCFNPARSDIDLLVVLRRGMTRNERYWAAQMLLELSNQPRPIEISFLSSSQLHPWKFPTPYECHYSEAWRARFSEALSDGSRCEWGMPDQGDPDLAAHITVARARGVVLCGPPIAEAFPAVPPADYAASIRGDVDVTLDMMAGQPTYFILNLCRVYAYLREEQILSKAEGGRWALGVLPEVHQSIVQAALESYRGEAEPDLPSEALYTFVTYVRDCIARLR